MAPNNGHHFTSEPFSVSTNAPFSIFPTASRGDSRQSSRLGWYSPFPPTSSSQLHTRNDSHGHLRSDSKDNGSEEKVSATDAKRFTPSLHASLVSEILSLRREIESKDNALASLEDSLQRSKNENGLLEATVTNQEWEIRSAKKQMQLLESGTLSALGDIAKERDDAEGSLAEARKRLEASKSTVRGFEEDARRNQAMWEQDKQNWDNEKRNIERKIHVAEGRLKIMVNEVAAAQNSSQLASACGSDVEEGAGETWFSNWSDIISTRSSSVKGRHHLSEFSNNTYDTNEMANFRNSTSAARASLIITEPNSLSLADELDFEEAIVDHSGEHKMEKGNRSPDALPEEEDPFKARKMSVQSQDCKARKILGLTADAADQSLSEEHPFEQPLATVLEQPLRTLQASTKPIATCQDMGTQYSTPPSPKTAAQEPTASEKDLYRYVNTENTANQRRKRVSIAATSHDSSPLRIEQSTNWSTASAACQTMPQATSPPLVPMIALEPMFPDPGSIMGMEMISCSTQTDDISQVANIHASIRDPSSSIMVPVIAIHPPGTRPSSSYNTVMLPPQTKNAACQTELASILNVKSVGIQTEGIRVDKRAIQIPPRLMSGSIPSKPQSWIDQPFRRPAPKVPRFGLKEPPPIEPPRILQTRSKPPKIQIAGPYVAQHTDLSANRAQMSKASPINPDDLFAGFGDQEGQGMDVDFSDEDDFANVAPIRKTLSKVKNSWTLVPTSANTSLGPRPLGRPISDIQEIDDISEVNHYNTQANRKEKASDAKVGQHGGDEKLVLSIHSSKKSDVRKAALLPSGDLAHLRQRSPSEPGPSTASSVVPPPFPVPTRSSSRKIPISASDGNGSPLPYTTSFITSIRNRNQVKAAGPRNPLRKVRSAAAVPKSGSTQSRQDENEGDSSALPSPTSTSFSRSQVPQTRQTQNALQPPSALSSTVNQEPSRPVSHAAEADTDSPSQTTSVVDAIAQTMVGEWMWKYVRKRKSFGMVESAQVEFEEGRSNHENSSGIRHKRWVWLAPYERAVIWSSKQPTSGSALMGKGGRKLTIQSVVDVRDDTPMPKNAGIRSAFSRSILIITPQRALKFTAPDRERHYIWLTALSFLSHSTLGMEDLTAMPPLPQAEYQLPMSSGAGTERRFQRDPLRITKGKERPALHGRILTAPVVTGGKGKQAAEGLEYDGANDSASEAAEPPQILRVSAHARKRSSTGPRPSLQSAFYSFPSNVGRPASRSAKQTAAQDSTVSVTRGFPGSSSGPSATTRQKPEPTMVEPEAVRNDFFDAVGTVRMEAFVDEPLAGAADIGHGKSLHQNSFRTRKGRKKDMSYWGIQGEGSNRSGPASTLRRPPTWRVEDPFRGF